MTLKDFVVTPLLLFILYSSLYFYRKKLSDHFLKKIFFPAFTLKVISAIILGIIYQFYYTTGDTFSYYNQALILNEVFDQSFSDWIRLIFSDGTYTAETYVHATKLYYYIYPTEFTVIKITAILGMITSNSYSSIAILFSLFSFLGLWKLLESFIMIYPRLKLEFAISIFFLPSVFFWGSGLLKESLVMGSMGFVFYFLYNLAVKRKFSITYLIVFVFSIWLLYMIKVYILLSFLPPLTLWLIVENNRTVTNNFIRWISFPIYIIIGFITVYFLVTNITAGDAKYDLNNIAERVKINADWIYYVSQRDDGSAYYLGELDGSFESILKLSPSALVVTLFRPFLWEVKNPLMLVAALESSFFILFTLFALVRNGVMTSIKTIFINPFILMCLGYSFVLAIAAGLTSYNFGTLVRYKIPFLPFYTAAIFLVLQLPKLNQVRERTSS